MTVRILHLCNTASGAPWLVEILRQQRALGHHTHVILAGEDGDLAGAIRALGIPCDVLDHDLLADANVRRAVVRLWRLVRLLRRHRPDILQSHLFPSTIAGRMAAWIADVPIRLSMNAGPYYLESPALRVFDLETAWADTKIIASCEYVRRLYVQGGVPAGRIELVYYGSNEARFEPAGVDRARVRRELGVGDATPLVGQVAYFYPPGPAGALTPPHLVSRGIKGHDVLLRAVPIVLETHPDARFALVGRGWTERGVAHEQEMRDLAASLGVSHAVLFAGYRPDVPDVLATFDIALQCSLSENLGGSIEALLMEAPLIVARTGGLVDAVIDGRTGLVVPPDDPPALAAAIVRLLDDRPLAARLGASGRAFMLERFTARRTAEDLDAVYERAVAEGGFGDSPPRESGYRIGRSIARLVWAPLWVARIVRSFHAATRPGHGVAAYYRSLLTMIVRAVVRRLTDALAATIVLIAASPLLLVVWAARPGRTFARRMVNGRYAQPFALVVFPGDRPRALRKLPWFFSLFRGRLTLFGPEPLPFDPAHPTPRSDPRVARRPGIFDHGTA